MMNQVDEAKEAQVKALKESERKTAENIK